MKTKSRLNRRSYMTVVIAVLCAVAIIFAQHAAAFDGISNGNIKSGVQLGGDRSIMSATTNRLSSGAVETKVVSNNKAGTDQTIDYMCEVNLDDPYTEIEAGYGKDGSIYDGSMGDLKTQMVQTGDQAAAYTQKTGNQVAMAMNADFFDMTNGNTLGALVVNGKVYRDNKRDFKWYFGVTKEGKAVISNNTDLSNLKMAVGGIHVIVKNGKVVDDANDWYGYNKYTRCAIGISADGKKVISISSYGMNAPVSCGHTAEEVGNMLVAAGCETALLLDCGGSVTYLSKYEGSSDLVCRNTPSDGAQRSVGSTILVVAKNGEKKGQFDHASITPNNEIFTPGAEVELKAKGVDPFGNEAKLPESDLEWSIDDASMGTIDSESGIFVSNGTEGVVTAELKYQGEVVGSTSFQIRVPDSIGFTTAKLALMYNKTDDLGIYAKYKGEEVVLKDGDIKWTINEDKDNKLNALYGATGYFDEVQAGSGQGLIFHTNVNKPYSGSAEITAEYGELKASIKVEVGKAPIIAMDFEKQEPIGKVLWDANCKYFYKFVRGTNDESSPDYTPVTTSSFINNYKTNNSSGALYDKGVAVDGTSNSYYVTQTRGGNESGEYVTTDDEEWRDIVRFGNSAFKLNYDFSGAIGIEGADFGYSKEVVLDGSATKLGVWVYAPENTPNLWLRMRVKVTTSANPDGVVNTINFTERADSAYSKSNGKDYGGINWTGWKYVETDLSQYQGQGCTITLLPGESIRVMYTNGAYGDTAGIGMGNRLSDGTYVSKEDCKGWLLFDNLTVVFGNNTEDITNPVVGDICTGSSIGDLTSLDGAVLTDNTFNIFAEMNDQEDTDENATGLVTRQVQIDNKKTYTMQQIDQYGFASGIKLSNGEHDCTIYVKDNNGNVTKKTVSFTVDADTDAPEVGIETLKSSAAPGQPYKISATTTNASDTKHIEGKITIDNKYPVEVSFDSNYDGEFKYNEAKGILEFSADRKADAAGGNFCRIMTAAVQIPEKVTEGTAFSFKASNGNVEFVTEHDGETSATFAGKTKKINIKAKIFLEADTQIVSNEGIFRVKDKNGNPLEGVNVFLASTFKKLGTTDEDGIVRSSKLTAKAGKYDILAIDEDGNYSYTVTVPSYECATESADPYLVLLNAADGTSKNITWLSHALKSGETPVVEYTTNEDHSGALTAEGTSTLISFSSDAKIARVNKVELSSLERDKTYYYRAGDGENWSEWKQFTVVNEDETNFAILGDTQSADSSVISKIIADIKGDGTLSFASQVGDSVENPTLYSDWNEILGVFSNYLGDTDMIHVIGNHELFGDANGNAVSSIYGLEAEDYYSSEYDNVYVASITYSEDRAKLREAVDWLVKDASASNATWKILVMHQPPYYTNTEGGNEYINEIFPAACEAAGIDAVFSGHDHSLARTNPLYQGEVDEENGVLYYICGSTGEKKYSIASQSVFDYSRIFAEGFPTQSFEATYIKGHATDEKLTIEIYDTRDGLIDTYTLKTNCGKEGHKYIYNYSQNKVVCTECGKVAKEYTGLVTSTKGYTYYLLNGEKQTGWKVVGENAYFFSDKGISKEISVKEDVPTSCTVRGHKTYTSKYADEDFTVKYQRAAGHVYNEDRVCTECGWHEIDLKDADISLSYTKGYVTGKEKKPTVTVKYGKGKNERTFVKGQEYTVSYENNINVGTATVTITPKTKYVGDKVNYRGSFAPGEVVLTFDIAPVMKELKLDYKSKTQAWVKFGKTEGITQYKVYYKKSTSSKYKFFKTIKANEKHLAKIKSLKAGTKYTIKVVPYTTIDGRNVTGKSTTIDVKTKK